MELFTFSDSVTFTVKDFFSQNSFPKENTVTSKNKNITFFTVDMFLKCSKIISKIKQATSISKLGFEKIEKSPALDIFLNEDSSFKNIKEIMTNETFYEIDKRIIYAFF